MALYKEWLEHDNLLKVEAWARDGLSDEQISHNIGITTTTYYDWKKKYSEFSKAIKKGKEVVDIEVENALLKLALGGKYKDTKIYKTTDKDGNSQTRIETYEKTLPPNLGACCFWLTNRKSDKWKNLIKENVAEIDDGVEIIDDAPKS